MKHQILKGWIGLALIILIPVSLLLFVITGYGTGFARACKGVDVGMSKEEALSKMSKYFNDNGVLFSSIISSTTEELGYSNIKESYWGGYYQCSIFVDKQNRVTDVSAIFD